MKKLIIVSAIFLGLGLFTRADTLDVQNNFYYVFHLYYDNGQLYSDRESKFQYDIIPGEYTADSVTTQFPYHGEIINVLGGVANSFIFDPRGGDMSFTKGKISVEAPYVADGQKAVFFDAQNKPILTVPVSDSSFCDDNGICDSERGEDFYSCPRDCKQQTLPVPTTTPASSGGSASSGLIPGILYSVIGLILLGLVWWMYRRRRMTGSLSTSVSSFPTSSLPTPPAPPTQDNKVQ